MFNGTETKNRILTVTQLTSHIRNVLENDRTLQNVWVRGEISDFKFYQKSGHMYFTLKDEEASVNSVMFKGKARNIDFMPESGMKVMARGYISIFEKYGRYQYYVEEMEPDGLGRLYLLFTQLKEKLGQEGLFDADRKRPLPRMVSCLGIVTSTDGAALRDIVRVVRQRHPSCNIVVAGSSVQGSEAPREIARAIKALNEWGRPEVMIVGRGGGSLEDLWAFNTEEVVRAIASSKIPVISAVGHEVDYSLADMAADLRAATPTQAGQLAVPDMHQVQEQLLQMTLSMKRCVERTYNMKWAELDYMRERRIWRKPIITDSFHQELRQSGRDLLNSMKNVLQTKDKGLHRSGSALEALSPLKVLDRGYAIARKENGEILRDIDQVGLSETLDLTLKNGEAKVKVLEKRVGEWQ
ncbi:MAG: exodeoxyribonuclease VII large subunit [Ignavibacteriales bacterium]